MWNMVDLEEQESPELLFNIFYQWCMSTMSENVKVCCLTVVSYSCNGVVWWGWRSFRKRKHEGYTEVPKQYALEKQQKEKPPATPFEAPMLLLISI